MAALTVFKSATEAIENAGTSTRPAGVSFAVEYNGDWGELWNWPAGDNDTLQYNSTFDCDEYSGRMEEVGFFEGGVLCAAVCFELQKRQLVG